MWRVGLIAAGAVLVWGCADDTECVIDTDCPNLFDRCEANRCVPRGARDAGVDGAVDANVPDAGDAGPEPDGGLDGGPPEVRTGTIVARQTPLAEPGTSPHSLSASFAIGATGAECTTTTMDACEVQDCLDPAPPADAGVPMDAGPVPDAGVMPAPNAGTIVFDGDAMDIVLLPDGTTGLYAGTSGTGLLWNADGPVRLTALGDTVPGFMQAMTGPAQLSITAPSFTTSPLTIDRAGDFTVNWSAAITATLVVRLTNRETITEGTRTVTVQCAFDAAAGTTATIPSAVLEHVPVGTAGSLEIRSETRALVEPGDNWEVTIQLLSVARADTGTGATITASIVDSTP